MTNASILIYENNYQFLFFTPLAVLVGWALYTYLENRRKITILLNSEGRSNARGTG